MRNNSYFQIMKLSVLVVLLLSFVSTVKAQTFVCTDASIYNTNKSDKEIQRMKAEEIGAIFKLEFYDNCLKLKKEGRDGALVFDKINDSKYQIT